MPQLTRVLTQEDLQRQPRGVHLDLSAYQALLATVTNQGGVGGVLTLEEGESQRTAKRRLSMAAQQRRQRLVWRTAPAGELRFVLAEEGQPAPGSRRRQESAPGPEPAPAPPASNGRRRRRQA